MSAQSKKVGNQKNVRSLAEPRPEVPSVLSESGLLRMVQIIGSQYATPVIPPLIPVSKQSIWNWTRARTFPQPEKIGPRVTAWRVSEIREWLNGRRNW